HVQTHPLSSHTPFPSTIHRPTISTVFPYTTLFRSDNVGVSGVQFKLDGTTNLGTEDTLSPYSVAWNSMTATNGPHTLTAVARDRSEEHTSEPESRVQLESRRLAETDIIVTSLSYAS